jgi:type IV fimbrial biogenesis protein FimT
MHQGLERCDWHFPKTGERSGYTVLELLMVLALSAIITVMALPHFSALIDRWRVHQAIIELQGVIRFAHAQAIRTRSRVVIQAKPATCRSLQDAQNWSCGLTVFQSINQKNTRAPNQPSLREMQPFYALTVKHIGASNAFLSYGPHGAPIANPGRFEIYPAANPDSPAAQTICLSFGGRMRIQSGVGCYLKRS